MPPPRKRNAPRQRVEPQSLRDKLVRLFVKSKFETSEPKYLAQGSLDNILDRGTIMKELRKGKAGLHSSLSPDEVEDALDEISTHIHNSCQKVFIVALQTTDDAEFVTWCMYSFLYYGFNDCSLPIDDPLQQPRNPPQEFEDWGAHHLNGFFDKQWTVQAPVFDPQNYTYDLQAQCIMPFEESTLLESVGGFSSLYRVKIHGAHAERIGIIDVAIKKLFVGNGSGVNNMVLTDKFWNIEARALKEIKHIQHNAIVKCTAAIRQGNNRYFMFEWANGGNLRQYWAKVPEQSPSPRLILQVIKQLRELAEVLKLLHNLEHSLPNISPDQDMDEIDDPRQAQGGMRHGDLKPENILRFCDSDSDSGLGQLKIADMGLAKRHVLQTQDRAGQRTTMPSGTLRYNAPEAANTELPRSRLVDTWSMGGIIFEFIIWTLYGNNMLKIFDSDMTAMTRNQGWQYYETSQYRGEQANLNKGVKRWMDHLESNDPELQQGTKSALSDVFRIVRNRLLVVPLRSDQRSSRSSRTRYRATAQELFDELDKIYRNCDQERYLFTGKDRSHIPQMTL